MQIFSETAQCVLNCAQSQDVDLEKTTCVSPVCPDTRCASVRVLPTRCGSFWRRSRRQSRRHRVARSGPQNSVSPAQRHRSVGWQRRRSRVNGVDAARTRQTELQRLVAAVHHTQSLLPPKNSNNKAVIESNCRVKTKAPEWTAASEPRRRQRG